MNCSTINGGNYAAVQDARRDAIVVVHNARVTDINLATTLDVIPSKYAEAVRLVNEAIDQPTQ